MASTTDNVMDVISSVPDFFSDCCRKIRLVVNGENLDGKVVMITGASSGIGQAMAQELYWHGCKLILSSRDAKKLNDLKQQLVNTTRNKGTTKSTPFVLPLDLADLSSLEKKGTEALQAFGHIDVLINNGGIMNRGSVIESSMEAHYKIMNVNYFGTVALTKALLPSMMSRKSGHIVNISSLQGLFGYPYASIYGASKHALQAFGDSLRAEVDAHGIKVTSFCPGYVDTGIAFNALDTKGTSYQANDPLQPKGYPASKVAQRIHQAILLGECEVIMAPIHHKLVPYLRRLCPNLTAKIMAGRARQYVDFHQKEK